jgi:hypothetical protein
VLNTTTFTGDVECQLVADGASCKAPSAGYLTAQLCEQDAECKNGQKCILQTCTVFNIQVRFCGLVTQAPYNCKANADQ